MDNKKQSESPRIPTRSRFADATLSDTRITTPDLDKIFKWLKSCKNFLLVLGAPGTGKTHFCKALYNYVRKSSNIESFRYWNESKLMGRVRSDMLEFGDFERCLSFLIDDQLIIWDDMGSTGVNDWRKTIIFSFVDQRYESQKPTVITTNMTREGILQELGERTHSRLFAKENTIIDLQGKDWRQEEPKTGHRQDA